MHRTLNFRMIGEGKIYCAFCESRITNGLKRLPGVRKVRVSAQDQHVLVVLNPLQISSYQVSARLKELGYNAEPDTFLPQLRGH
jgi:copper chaperone CopZ